MPDSDQSERVENLVRRFAEGDDSAVDLLIDCFKEPLLRRGGALLSKYWGEWRGKLSCSGAESAEELLWATFGRLAGDGRAALWLTHIEEGGDPLAYLYTVQRSQFADAVRKMSKQLEPRLREHTDRYPTKPDRADAGVRHREVRRNFSLLFDHLKYKKGTDLRIVLPVVREFHLGIYDGKVEPELDVKGTPDWRRAMWQKATARLSDHGRKYPLKQVQSVVRNVERDIRRLAKDLLSTSPQLERYLKAAHHS